MNNTFTMTSNNLLGAVDPFTYMIFASLKSHFPKCFPSIARISKLANCSHVTVIRRLKKLQSMGIITIIKGRKGQSNRYLISDNYLTEKESAAQKTEKWLKSSWRNFFGSKKVVNHRSSNNDKVVNLVTSNKINIKQEQSFTNSNPYYLWKAPDLSGNEYIKAPKDLLNCLV